MENPWHEGLLGSLDLETTGVDPLTDRIVSYALLDEQTTVGLVDPGVPIPAAASAVHGIDDAAVRGAASPAAGVAAVVSWLQSLIEQRVPVVVFNAAYDLTLVRAEAQRHGVEQPMWERLVVIDPFVLDAAVDASDRGRRRLVDVAAFYGVALDHAHAADSDAQAAREVAVAIAERHLQVASVPPERLMIWQRHWFAGRVTDWNVQGLLRGRQRLEDPGGWPLAS